MISPLDIYIVKIHQFFHNNIRSWTTVKNITDDMKIINGQILDQVA